MGLTNNFQLLMWFEALLGLRINLEKSELYPIGRVIDVVALTTVVGCKVGSLPATFLGLLLGARYNLVGVWMEWRSASKRGWLYGRDNTSQKEEESHLEAHCQACRSFFFKSLFHLPRMVRLLLDQIQWNFLLGGGNLKKKPHLVKWETICMDKKNGGFSVKSLGSLDKALLSKWC